MNTGYYQQAPMTGYPSAAVVSPTPVYTRRCGFWFLILSSIMAAMICLSAVYLFWSDRVLVEVFHELDLSLDNPLGYKIFMGLYGASAFIAGMILLHDEKLTTEPGNYWKVFGLFYVPCFFIVSIEVFLNPFDLSALIMKALEALVLAAVLAVIFTIPEDYDGCCACLKCVKPYKEEQTMPVFMNYIKI